MDSSSDSTSEDASSSPDSSLSEGDSLYVDNSQSDDGSGEDTRAPRPDANPDHNPEPKLKLEGYFSFPKPKLGCCLIPTIPKLKLEGDPISSAPKLKLEGCPISPIPPKLERSCSPPVAHLESSTTITQPSCLFAMPKPPSPYSVLARDLGTPRPLSNHISIKPVPWLDHLLWKRSIYEARLNRKRWASLRPGQVVKWSDGKRTVKTKVTETRTYADFDVAFRDLGPSLLPHISTFTPEHTKALYRNFYSNEEVQAHGVIAFKLEVQ